MYSLPVIFLLFVVGGFLLWSDGEKGKTTWKTPTGGILIVLWIIISLAMALR